MSAAPQLPPAPSTSPASSASDREIDAVLTSFDTNYVWNYGNVKEGLRELYEKAKRDQWNASEKIPWETPVDPEGEIIPAQLNPFEQYAGFRKMSEKEVDHFNHAQISWQLSQFLHGEQGALIVASQLVSAVPWMDAKYYAATQTMDEARHVEVFGRYLNEKLEWEWPINPQLRQLLDLIICDSRWDFKYLGMQILVEGLAMAAFANLHVLAQEPLVKEIVHNVMRDESRHVAFGVLSLQGYYDDMSASERRDREDFVLEACELMRDRLIPEEVTDYVGFDRAESREIMLESPVLRLFRQQLFARVVPNVKRLGLLTPRVRAGFERLDILHFQDNDPEEQDRALGLV